MNPNWKPMGPIENMIAIVQPAHPTDVAAGKPVQFQLYSGRGRLIIQNVAASVQEALETLAEEAPIAQHYGHDRKGEDESWRATV